MPKIVDYPRGSLKAALELASAVDALGGASAAMAAESLGKKVSGAFSAQVSAATKYGLVEAKSQKLTVTQLYRDYKLSYTPEEGAKFLRAALLNVPLYHAIVSRFAGKELPVGHFEKLLVREFEVPEDWASRVAGYFIDAGRQCGLLGDGNRIVSSTHDDHVEEELKSVDEVDEDDVSPMVQAKNVAAEPISQPLPLQSTQDYVVTITGPGINTSIRIADTDDMLILQATLKKVERVMKISKEGS